MKISICGGIIVLAVALVPQIVRAEGTMTYLSDLGQPSAGSLAVGSDSWLAAGFSTGTNANGYTLNSIQLGMTDASGNPSNFMVMLYANVGPLAIFPGSSIGTLDGSLSPTTAGIFSYTPDANLTLSPSTFYYIVLTAGTTVANGAYDWSYAGTSSYNGSWASLGGIWTSSNGSFSAEAASGYLQFAINAMAIPEPGVFGLLGLGGLAFLWHRRNAKAV